MLLNRLTNQKGNLSFLLTKNKNWNTLGCFNPTRNLFGSSKSKKEEVKSNKSEKKNLDVTENFQNLPYEQRIKVVNKLFKSIGIARDIYIFPDFKLTDYFLHPIAFLKAIMYKAMDISQSFVYVYSFRKAMPGQLRFNLMRQAAIKIFYQVHHSFAENELSKLYPYVNTNVALALKKRRDILNKKGYNLSWKVLEFKTTPTARNATAIPLPTYKSHFISIGYKFDTVQELIVKDDFGKVISSKTQRIVDNFVFLFDTETGGCVLQGKIPAKKINEKPLTKAQLGSHANPQDLFKKYADIFA
ncbi:uncharacterized protein HGUI_02228 [Hanseniaspora guilliermondii]|uniref:Uncharacterized protein n=1 Tax=Hanseniaspora guilliermondii TaxID=56406 RepID=A0A1L0B2I3_9ASCO|nr:uncharacterized protein HGUI_02228 [Hanseniaspora guilliermondii]